MVYFVNLYSCVYNVRLLQSTIDALNEKSLSDSDMTRFSTLSSKINITNDVITNETYTSSLITNSDRNDSTINTNEYGFGKVETLFLKSGTFYSIACFIVRIYQFIFFINKVNS